jgi:hypothetical protein
MKPKILSARFWSNILGLLRSSEQRAGQQQTLQPPLPPPASETAEASLSWTEQSRKPDEEHSGQESIGQVKGRKAAESRTAGRLTVRSELNLEKNAIFTVSTYRKKSREVVIKETGSGGKVAERTIVVGRTAEGVETGVLTTNHFRIYLALIELWEKAGKPINDPVHFTVYKIIKRLDLRDDGRTYAGIKRSLYGLRQIPVEFVDSFFAPDEGDFRSLRPFTVLSYLDIYERKKIGKRQRTRGYGEFQFDRHILASLINNYTHPLRLDVISSFKKHKDLSILIYTFIDRNLAFKDRFEIGLENLFKTLDLSQRHVKYPSDRKRVVDPVLEQLRGKQLSTGVLSYAQILKTTDGRDYKLACRKKPFPKRLEERGTPSQPELPIPTKTEPESAESSSELFPLLIKKGLTQKQAAKLIAEKSPEIISNQLEYLAFRLREYESQRKEINEPAILYESISDNWKVPKSYLEAEKEKEREAERLEQERIACLEQEEWDREDQERARMEAYKQSLGLEERAKLRERALEEIRSMEGVKEGFIGDILIELKENQILRSEIEKDEN